MACEFLNPTPTNEGELNYAITRLCHDYIRSKKGPSYAVLNSVHGVLHCADLELYRTVTAPYEDTKREANGSVSELDAKLQYTTVQTHSELTADDIIRALKGPVREQEATVGPAKQPAAPVQEQPVTPAPAPQSPAQQSASEQASSRSTTRRPARVIGTAPGGGVEAPPSTPVAPAVEPPSQVGVRPPRGHTVGGGVDRHVASVWEREASGNGEEIDI